MTVAVSISAGVLAITSAAPRLDAYRVELCLGFLAVLMVGNLRGLKESGRIFAVPTYFFVVSIFVLIAAGLYRYAFGGIVPVEASGVADGRIASSDVVSAADRIRQRLHRDDRRRSGVERRAGIPPA